jgi:hypothetical protein
VSTAAQPIRRNMVVQRWGTPQATVGSVNEPRERSENGVCFNERWLYRVAGHGSEPGYERIVYWLRYDFVASFVIKPDGSIVREEPRALLAGVRDRLYLPPSARHAEA